MKKLVLIALSGTCSPCIHAAPMLLTTTGYIDVVEPGAAASGLLGSEIIVTWSFDSDNAGSDLNLGGAYYKGIGDNSNWIKWRVYLPATGGPGTSEFSLAPINLDVIRIVDNYGTSAPTPFDQFSIYASTSMGDGKFSEVWSASIASETRNLINSNLDQEQFLTFLDTDPYARGSYLFVGQFNNIVIEYQIRSWKLDNLEIEGEPASVPEPGSIAMMGLGLLGSGLVRRARTHQS